MGTIPKLPIRAHRRLFILVLSATIAPLVLLLLPYYLPGIVASFAAPAALLVAITAAYLVARSITRGLVHPVEKVSMAAKSLAASDGRLDSALSREGWPEGIELISAMNRLMLELGAFRSFHLNQVVEDKAKAQALIDTITDGVLLADDTGRVIYSNQRALSLLGIPQKTESVSLPGSVTRAEFSVPVAQAIYSFESQKRVEIQLPVLGEHEGVFRTFALISRPFNLASLKKPGRVIVLRDITVKKEIEEARETFFQMITHDMRAPLASIQGYAQMLGMKPDIRGHADLEKFVNIIVRSSKRLNGMVDDILNTIKLERGEMELRPVPLDAAQLCREIQEVYEPLASRKNIKLRLAGGPEKLEFKGDPGLIERVISNLVGNALKFTPPEGSVTLSWGVDDGIVVFAVEDTGPGIPADKQSEIFEKFSQMEQHKYMGFGLGLAMCKLVAELHKGRVWVESEEGQGSRFLVSLPRLPL